MTDEINEKTRFSVEIKYMIGSIIFMVTTLITAVSGYNEIKTSVKLNTRTIALVAKKQDTHLESYQKMNSTVVANGVTLKNIESDIKDTKEDLKYLIRKADSK
jgi:gas vesicle protein